MSLNGKKVMILAASGTEESDLTAAQRELIRAGATVHTVAVEPGLVNCWNKITWGLYLPVDKPIGTTLAADYDMLVVPGGKRGVTKLAANPHSERIIGGFVAAMKPMAFMGDAVELLAMVGHIAGRKVAGPEASQAVVAEKGAEWSRAENFIDNNLLTGDSARDPVAFAEKIVQHFIGGAPMKAAA